MGESDSFHDLSETDSDDVSLRGATHDDALEVLIERWRRWADRSDGTDAYARGYNGALLNCADELERLVDSNNDD